MSVARGRGRQVRWVVMKCFAWGALTWCALVACSSSKDTLPPGATCPASFSECSSGCVDPRADRQNCGACGKACAPGEVCSAGACALDCGGGTKKCGASCVATASDPQNCGDCGKACDGGKVCVGGACAVACPASAKKCGDGCVDTMLSPLHCGGCDLPCKQGEVCSQGKCGVTCLGGATKCGDLCVDTKNDPGYCGDCMTACKAGEVCAAGKCTKSCAPGETLCSGVGCVDLTGRAKYCGACDKACNAGQVCSKGNCIAGALYGAEGRNGNFGYLFTVDPATGGVTKVALLDEPIAAAAFKDGDLYGASFVTGAIYRINVGSGALTKVASTSGAPSGLGLRADGLFSSCHFDEFVTVDPGNGTLTHSNVFNCNDPSAFGADAQHKMYFVKQGVLLTLDDNFGQQFINGTNDIGGTFKGVTFHQGTLYAVHFTGASGELVTINTGNGIFKKMGSILPSIQALASPMP